MLRSINADINDDEASARSASPGCFVGILPGEGSGPEVIAAARLVLKAVSGARGLHLELIGNSEDCRAPRTDDCAHLSAMSADFCDGVFRKGGAILAGAVGGRFVYEMRRRFKLFYKLNPLRSYPELNGVCRLKPGEQPVDVLVVRENLDGLYQGDSVVRPCEEGVEIAHTFFNREPRIRAVVDMAAKHAQQRRRSLTVVAKDSGLPAIHSLWRRCAEEAGERREVKVTLLDIDYAAYKLLHEPWSLDVVVAPNCFGDILSDLGGLLAGSRGLTFGASFSAGGAAVYQTNHGAAHDLAQTNSANPVGQIFSVAMMLRETFGLAAEAELIEDAVRSVWRSGWRTADLREAGCSIAGTQEFAQLVTAEIERKSLRHREACSAAG